MMGHAEAIQLVEQLLNEQPEEVVEDEEVIDIPAEVGLIALALADAEAEFERFNAVNEAVYRLYGRTNEVLQKNSQLMTRLTGNQKGQSQRLQPLAREISKQEVRKSKMMVWAEMLAEDIADLEYWKRPRVELLQSYRDILERDRTKSGSVDPEKLYIAALEDIPPDPRHRGLKTIIAEYEEFIAPLAEEYAAFEADIAEAGFDIKDLHATSEAIQRKIADLKAQSDKTAAESALLRKFSGEMSTCIDRAKTMLLQIEGFRKQHGEEQLAISSSSESPSTQDTRELP